jgi:DNA-binding transcriptional MerR regulator/effector-binding domain-containing protein
MFKIGDFSRLAQISVRMLRHYDKLGLLEPSYTDRFTGYRYYTIDQLPRLNRIVALNDLGLTLAQIADLLGKDDKLPAEQLRGMLALRRAELARELEEKRWQLASVEARLQQIEMENEPEPDEIVVKSLDSLSVVSIRHLAPSVQEVGYFCATLYGQIYQRLGRLGVIAGNPELTLYHNEEYAEHDIDMEVAVPVADEIVAAPPRDDQLCFRTVAGSDLAAALIYEGPFSGIVRPIQSLLRWVGLHDHASVGALRELHLSGRAHDGTADAMRIIELQIPIAPITALPTQAVE